MDFPPACFAAVRHSPHNLLTCKKPGAAAGLFDD